MAAVLAPIPADRSTRSPSRPALRVVPGGRGGRSALIFRRRLLALALVIGVIAGVAVVAPAVASLPSRWSAGAATDVVTSPGEGVAPVAPPVTEAARRAGVALTGSTYVVQPGDTLWAIARQLQPEGDVRPLVDELSDRLAGRVLQAGQRLNLEGFLG